MKRLPDFMFALLEIVIVVALLNMLSCSPILYTAIGQNVPLLEQKGEGRISVGLASTFGKTSDNIFNVFYDDYASASGVSSQFSVATGDHTCIMASYYALKKTDIEWSGQGSYGEVGLGRFGKGKNDMMIGEVIIGTGFGKIQSSNSGGSAEVKYFKPFIQPTFGIRGKYFEIAFTGRVAMVRYTFGQSKGDPADVAEFNNFMDDRRSSIVLEPGVTMRAGAENFKFTLQFSSTNFKDKVPDVNPVLRNFISIGIDIRFSPKKEDGA